MSPIHIYMSVPNVRMVTEYQLVTFARKGLGYLAKG